MAFAVRYDPRWDHCPVIEPGFKAATVPHFCARASRAGHCTKVGQTRFLWTQMAQNRVLFQSRVGHILVYFALWRRKPTDVKNDPYIWRMRWKPCLITATPLLLTQSKALVSPKCRIDHLVCAPQIGRPPVDPLCGVCHCPAAPLERAMKGSSFNSSGEGPVHHSSWWPMGEKVERA